MPEAYEAWSIIAGDIGTFFFYLFVWYVFRRESLVAKLSLAAVAVVLVVSVVRDTIIAGEKFARMGLRR